MQFMIKNKYLFPEGSISLLLFADYCGQETEQDF